MRKALTILSVSVVVIVVALLGVDTGFAINAERSFAQSLSTSSHTKLTFEPEVTISGFPAVRAVSRGHYSAIGITARAVDITGAGTCTDAKPCHADLRSRLKDVQILGSERWFTRFSRLHVGSATNSVTLDSVAVGRLLGIDDLTVNTPAPAGKAGGGGPQDGLLSRTSGVLLTGSVSLGPGRAAVKVSVTVDLSVVASRMRLRATDFYKGTEEHSDTSVAPADRAAVLSAFSTTLPYLPMPWGAPAKSARSSGSDLVLEGAPEWGGGYTTMSSFLLPPNPITFTTVAGHQPS